MPNFERTTSWQQIQQGVKDIERLLGRNDYNLVMVKARQVLECMVRCMAEKACLVEGDLADTIDQLFESRLISKTTRDNYHTIRILGNKAVHEGDNTPYDADKAYKLLTQEVYAFASELQGRSSAGERTSRGGNSQRSSSGQRGSQGNRAPSGQRRPSSGSRQGSSRPQGRSSHQGASRQGSGRRKKRRRVSPLFYIWRLLIPVLILVLLVVVIRVFTSGKDKEPAPTSASSAVTVAAPEPPPTLPPEPPAETPEEPAVSAYRIKGNGVNVRSAPSTDANSTVLVQLSNGTEVEYVKRYNDDWAVINYDGREAYVSNQFLERIEAEGETEASQQGEN